MLKPKPWWLRLVTGEWVWVTISPNIYHPDVDPLKYPAIIEHENVHIVQQNTYGLAKWLFRYFTSRSFRFDQEVRAMLLELALYPEPYRTTRIDEYAKALSSSAYFWATAYDKAKAALSKGMTT